MRTRVLACSSRRFKGNVRRAGAHVNSECALRHLHPPVLVHRRVHHHQSPTPPPSRIRPRRRWARYLYLPLVHLPVPRHRSLVRRTHRGLAPQHRRLGVSRRPTPAPQNLPLPRLYPRPHRVLVLVDPAVVAIPRGALVVGPSPGHRRGGQAPADVVVILEDVLRQRRHG